MAATAGPLRAALTRRSVPTHPAPPPPLREGGPRWPSVARMLDHAEQIMAAPAVPVVGVGRSAGSPTAVTVRLGMPATLSCTLDPAWAIAATPAQAATALAHALADAHRALHAATAAGATAALADLAAATLDHLHTLLAAARHIS